QFRVFLSKERVNGAQMSHFIVFGTGSEFRTPLRIIKQFSGIKPTLCHGDLWAPNLLWRRVDGQLKLVALIDYQVRDSAKKLMPMKITIFRCATLAVSHSIWLAYFRQEWIRKNDSKIQSNSSKRITEF